MMLTGPMLPLIRRMYYTMASIRPFNSATTVLDVGCGPGSATYTLLTERAGELDKDAKVVACDFSQGMVEQVVQLRGRRLAELALGDDENEPAKEKKYWQGLEAHVLDAQDLSPAIADGSVSHLIASLVMFMVPDSGKALREGWRVLETGGVMSVSSWKQVTWMELVMEAIGKKGADFKLPEKWADAGSVRKMLEGAGFVDVEVEEVETFMDAGDAKRLARWFLGSSNPPLLAMLKDLSEEEREEARTRLAGLFEERRDSRTDGIPGIGIVATGRKP